MRIDPAEIRRYSTAALQAVGVPGDEARTTADVLVAADLREVHSHGVLRLPAYVNRIQSGLLSATARITTVNETEWLSVLDGNNSLGQVVAVDAMERSLRAADATGIGLSVVRNSNHFGMASHYSLMAAHQNKIGIVLSNVAPLMPAAGGREKAVGNNPISIASPLSDGPLMLDMALSNSSLGKVLFARDTGRAVPADWGVNASGSPTTNPAEITDGGLLTAIGGPKGVGLALMIEVLTGVLSGGAITTEIPSMYDSSRSQSIAHFMLSIDVDRVAAGSDFEQRSRDLVNHFRSTKTADADTTVYLPGEIEARRERANSTFGPDLALETIQNLDDLAQILTIDPLTR